jgi:SMODS-associated and fused to various effectors sensor domain/HNH endonuclease
MSGGRHPKVQGTGVSRNYSDRTLKLLWGRAAGRCAMAECRMPLIADATDYDPVVVIGDMAHVAGASDGGPRAARELSSKERNDYENLILLCKNCHARIDQQTRSNPVEHLKEIKQAHEDWVRASLPERGRSRTGWTVLGLQGDHPIDLATADEALSPDFINGDPRWLKVPTDPNDWLAVDQRIAATARELMTGGDTFDQRIAVFPIAPVSACIALGYHLTSRPNVRHFQYHRDDHTWAWPRRAAPAQDITVSGLDNEDPDCRVVTFLFHFSAVIVDAALVEITEPTGRRVDFRVGTPSTAWLQHADQVRWAAVEERQAFERAMQLFPACELWRILYAGPAPVGVAIGQQLNPTMYPPVQLYEYRHKETPRYRVSILLGG